MTRTFPYWFFLLICLASCANHPSYWVPRDELRPAAEPNIKLIELTDSSTIIFDHNLGWFNPERQIIEGITITGWHDTTALAKIQRVEISNEASDDGNTALKAIGIALVACLALGVVMGIVLLNQFTSHGGCLVFIAVLGVTTTAAAVLIFA